MGLVYKNGVCNIAATAGKDGSRGCFSDRGAAFFQPLVLKTKRLGEVEHWSITAEDELMGYRMKPAWDSPLYSRGWVLQEWFLAPRILHFARHQIFWECSRGTASEAYPDLEDRDVIADMHHAGRSQKHALDFSVWSSIVYAYSSTSLTKATDKLPAVSAIAKEMGQRFGFDDGSAVSYLAGVWSFCLVQQLMWRSLAGWSE
ncbi:hypothetical protein GTA08_BOTSDO11913 [Neofusicoccum parvum]|uniref:Uncharacterized protein n=1 Tax=Neofusicoccum parvum TaxID=310453 RepID=A0ACB5SHV3_9PEZI|nr:hypothetical protein GTA08_BOTSDO11913 [Neofusicoccum parvum]GME60518.1 hypothetical protein GTA08_BOTSDO11913 [Neofusicoccum parvum]